MTKNNNTADERLEQMLREIKQEIERRKNL